MIFQHKPNKSYKKILIEHSNSYIRISSLYWLKVVPKWIDVNPISNMILGLAFNTYSMKTYVLLHFEHKSDVTIIVKLLYRATSRRRETLKFDNDCDVIFTFKL